MFHWYIRVKSNGDWLFLFFPRQPTTASRLSRHTRGNTSRSQNTSPPITSKQTTLAPTHSPSMTCVDAMLCYAMLQFDWLSIFFLLLFILNSWFSHQSLTHAAQLRLGDLLGPRASNCKSTVNDEIIKRILLYCIFRVCAHLVIPFIFVFRLRQKHVKLHRR